MKFIEAAKVSNRKFKIELSNLQAIHLVSVLNQLALEENLTKIIITNICNQLDNHFNAMEGFDLMVLEQEIQEYEKKLKCK